MRFKVQEQKHWITVEKPEYPVVEDWKMKITDYLTGEGEQEVDPEYEENVIEGITDDCRGEYIDWLNQFKEYGIVREKHTDNFDEIMDSAYGQKYKRIYYDFDAIVDVPYDLVDDFKEYCEKNYIGYRKGDKEKITIEVSQERWNEIMHETVENEKNIYVAEDEHGNTETIIGRDNIQNFKDNTTFENYRIVQITSVDEKSMSDADNEIEIKKEVS